MRHFRFTQHTVVKIDQISTCYNIKLCLHAHLYKCCWKYLSAFTKVKFQKQDCNLLCNIFTGILQSLPLKFFTYCPTVVHHPASVPACTGALQWLEAGIAWEVQLETEIALSPALCSQGLPHGHLPAHLQWFFLKAVATFFHHLNWSFHRWLLNREIHCHGLLPGNGLALMRGRWESGLDLYQEVVSCSSKESRFKLMRSPWCVGQEAPHCHWNNMSDMMVSCFN